MEAKTTVKDVVKSIFILLLFIFGIAWLLAPLPVEMVPLASLLLFIFLFVEGLVFLAWDSIVFIMAFSKRLALRFRNASEG